METGVDIAWSDDLSYVYLSEVLSTVRSNFESCLLQDAPRLINDVSKRRVFIRHDIDVAPRFALPVARMEAKLNLRASYQVMIDSPLYRIEDPSVRQVMTELLVLGHEVGLHVHVPDALLAGDPYSETILHHVNVASSQLESVIGRPVLSMSFHRPQQVLLRGPMTLDGKVNAYAERLMEWYLSDSAGRWRQGPPKPSLLRSPKPVLQLLIHPVWWGPTHMSGPDRLQAFFEEETRGKSEEFAAAFDAQLSDTMRGVQRSGHERRRIEEGA